MARNHTETAPNKLVTSALPKLFSKAGAFFLIVCIIGLFLTAQLVGVYLFTPLVFNEQTLTPEQRFGLGSFDGTVISYTMFFTMAVMVIAIYLLITWRIRRLNRKHKSINNKVVDINTAEKDILRVSTNQVGHFTFKEYLAIKPFTIRVGIGFLGLWLVFVIGSEVLSYVLGRDPTAFVDVLYYSANPKWLLILVMVVIVPLYEELMFRGILWSALQEQLSGSRGVWLASIITSLLFAIIHMQYAIYEMSVIFILALLLCYARAKSGSIGLPIIIHMINNGVAMWMYLTV